MNSDNDASEDSFHNYVDLSMKRRLQIRSLMIMIEAKTKANMIVMDSLSIVNMIWTTPCETNLWEISLKERRRQERFWKNPIIRETGDDSTNDGLNDEDIFGLWQK